MLIKHDIWSLNPDDINRNNISSKTLIAFLAFGYLTRIATLTWNHISGANPSGIFQFGWPVDIRNLCHMLSVVSNFF